MADTACAQVPARASGFSWARVWTVAMKTTRAAFAVVAVSLFFGVLPGRAEINAPISHASHDGCGYGVYRAPDGSCDSVKSPNAICQPGLHSVVGPFESGFRCVQDGY
jgi:hypothetical protein